MSEQTVTYIVEERRDGSPDWGWVAARNNRDAALTYARDHYQLWNRPTRVILRMIIGELP